MAVPADMMAALQGGAAAGGALPPDLAALLGAEEEPAGALHGGGAAAGDPEEFYRHALNDLESGMKADTDDARINTMLQCATKIQGELANSQKGADAMLGGKLDPSHMRRMSAADAAY